MDNASIIFRQATPKDLSQLLVLLANRDANDLRRLVWLPEPIEGVAIQNEIHKGRFFVALDENSGQIVAQRKVFIVEDCEELHDMQNNFLRCVGQKRKLVESGFFTTDLVFTPEQNRHFSPHDKTLHLYVGAAFTHHAYRSKKINERLNFYAYEQLRTIICHKIRSGNYTSVALQYILVDENKWRTRFLLRQFFPFAQSISTVLGLPLSSKISFFSYETYKPESFFTSTGKVISHGDEHCIKSTGCVLLYEL